MAVRRRLQARAPLAERILAQRDAGGAEVSLERLEADFADASRYEIVAALKELEKAGRGQFVVGRKGQRSRFVWGATKAAAPPRLAKKVREKRAATPAPGAARAVEVAPPPLSAEPAPKGSTRKALAAAGKRPERPQLSSRAAPEPPPIARAERSGSERPTGTERATGTSARTLSHAFHLRPGLLVNIDLPEDVTPTEVDRLCAFLKAIPFTAGGGR